MTDSLKDSFRQWLHLYWLRPENGLLLTWKSKVFEDIVFRSPSLDISCGDGMFMFLHAGGQFEDDFDYFQVTSAKQFTHDKPIDIFDAFDPDYAPKIKKAVDYQIDCGTDWKQSLLHKASRLNLYKKLVLHDNHITPFPFETEAFQTIYSNSIEWTPNSLELLKDAYRMLRTGGQATISATTGDLFNTLIDLRPYLSGRAIEILDRDRVANAPAARPVAEWRALMKEAGFKIDDIRIIWPNRHVIDLWNIGLRPIAHLLIQMADQISPQERLRIKREWVRTFFDLWESLLDSKTTYSVENAPYVLFIMSK